MGILKIAGVDLDLLDSQRKELELILQRNERVQFLDNNQAQALQGVVHMLDSWSDARSAMAEQAAASLWQPSDAETTQRLVQEADRMRRQIISEGEIPPVMPDLRLGRRLDGSYYLHLPRYTDATSTGSSTETMGTAVRQPPAPQPEDEVNF